MKETVRGYERRTGRSYEAPAGRPRGTRPLSPAEACPTLFRFPGARGIPGTWSAEPAPLAPPEAPWAWLAASADGTGTRGAAHFGVLAIPEPLPLQPLKARQPGAYLLRNRVLSAASRVWVPPALLRARLPWDRIRTPREARASFGSSYRRARDQVRRSLDAYFEELERLRHASVPDPGRPWCEVPEPRRRRILASAGIAPAWTPP